MRMNLRQSQAGRIFINGLIVRELEQVSTDKCSPIFIHAQRGFAKVPGLGVSDIVEALW